MKLNFKVM